MARKAFNEIAPIHWDNNDYLKKLIEHKESSFLSLVLLNELKKVGFFDKNVPQFNCNISNNFHNSMLLTANEDVGLFWRIGSFITVPIISAAMDYQHSAYTILLGGFFIIVLFISIINMKVRR
ncbi:hypothetical protein BB987_02755 [Photorhabdus temperata]|uniref:Uncharacterized protein n=1 Tax=Photorhabdus khanii TaxID=1004150 RepID=A0A7C9KTV2_9GAMM|nr:hypothetical protein [Photorhabdus khanii]MQL47389.1 hypothetical protein [Photorhabdus khanii]OHV49104.1 hypothetical protein BB987_02755 [Photorhabdus temperata]